MSTSKSKSVSPLAIAAAVGALVIFLGFLWYYYGRSSQPDMEHVVLPPGVHPGMAAPRPAHLRNPGNSARAGTDSPGAGG